MNIDIKRTYQFSLRILCASLLSIACLPALHADEWDKATKFTFADPVQIPGQVLPAGTYWFKLLDSASDRHIVQVFDQNKRIITTVLAINDYRMEPKGRTVVMFDERAGGQADAIKEWFYPGDNFGQEFVYPKSESLQTAQAAATYTPIPPTPEPAPVETAPAAAPEPVAPAVETPAEPAPQAAQPEQQPETPAVAPTAAPAPEEPTPAPATDTDTLPQTGSELPLIGLLGFSSLSSGLLFHILRRR